ncbi:hypothetical protein A5746_10365 [Mycolicibacterium conceptionense]|uniref:hypothetical protein n=1 Tax=Mycolicibacterium conceptionense TaxID=451644 RepID=UPI0007ECF2FE|nr:hypothetical protein [Mycolicibacterium conceptionense]OBK04692.1 hypothetical protein A5639_20690 [Mycolicibacterium conceptionense]OMB90329.1 hypothetical protein A5741_12165 [Mycolicibacterium conceptionense]OMC02090.1 hypothetical protein A5746_10365 [Mycolicibacterium conceptionense]
MSGQDDDYRARMTWAGVDGHALQIVGTLNPATRAEQWLPECSCGWIGAACATSSLAQDEIRRHVTDAGLL